MRTLSIVLLMTAATAAAAPSASRTLLTDLIDALNAKDRARLVEFARGHATADRPPEERAERLIGFAEQGAPFKIVEFPPEEAGSVAAVVEDREGRQLSLRIDLTPEGKMRALRIVPAGPPPKPIGEWRDLSALVTALQTQTKVPAMTVAVSRNGKLETATTGVRHLGGNDKVGDDEPWSIGSIGKPICATVVGRLIEMGKLDWQTTLGKALPDLAMRDEYKSVTLEELMHHRGGIPAELRFSREDVDRLAAGETDPRKMRERYARNLLQLPPVSKSFTYSNGGYLLLGLVAERAAGRPYEALVKDLVYKPLGLTHSYTAGDTLPAARPGGHERTKNGFEPRDMIGPLNYIFAPAGGGMFMSAADLARFGEAHLRGLRGEDTPLLKAATVERLHRGIAEMGQGSRSYACGWGIEDSPGLPTMHTHNGSDGTMTAQLALFPKAGLVVVSFMNSGWEDEPSPPLQAVLAVAGKYATSGTSRTN